MLRSEFAMPAWVPAGMASPAVQPSSADGPAFPSLFREVQSEVMAFIENGSDATSGATLSAEGQFHRASLQAAAAPSAEEGPVGLDREAFLAAVAPWAKETGQRLGVSADIIAAQAALESGWGRHPLRHPDGRDTHNLFGIKAGGNWQGEVAEARTTEYEQGAAQGRTERFRSFPDEASAFRDFARLLLENPRYRSALHTGDDARAYAQGLVRGGYATDPAYADKLVRLAARIQSGG